MDNKYNSNNKINLYKENLIKFIIGQKDKIIPIGSIEEIDYIIGILFLTETNRYFKQNKINIHGYYMAYTFINLFNKIRLKMLKSYKFEPNDINHFIISLSNNINYLNSRIDSTNIIKNKINNNFSKFNIELFPILTNLVEYNKKHDDIKENKEILLNNLLNENLLNENLLNENLLNENNFCDIKCYTCWVTNILSKFFYLLLQTAKFLGSGSYNDPNLIRLSEYYANIFYTLFKSNDIILLNCKNYNSHTELYENYLNYKNKLNYSLIELDLSSETLDEIINYIDNEIIEILSIKIK